MLDGAMTEPPGSEHTDTATPPSELDQERRTSMAAERTWLAWWRTALGATAGALAVGRFAPKLLDVAAWRITANTCSIVTRKRLTRALTVVARERCSCLS